MKLFTEGYLKEKRGLLQKSQAEIAYNLDVHINTVQNWERTGNINEKMLDGIIEEYELELVEIKTMFEQHHFTNSHVDNNLLIPAILFPICDLDIIQNIISYPDIWKIFCIEMDEDCLLDDQGFVREKIDRNLFSDDDLKEYTNYELSRIHSIFYFNQHSYFLQRSYTYCKEQKKDFFSLSLDDWVKISQIDLYLQLLSESLTKSDNDKNKIMIDCIQKYKYLKIVHEETTWSRFVFSQNESIPVLLQPIYDDTCVLSERGKELLSFCEKNGIMKIEN